MSDQTGKLERRHAKGNRTRKRSREEQAAMWVEMLTWKLVEMLVEMFA